MKTDLNHLIDQIIFCPMDKCFMRVTKIEGLPNAFSKDDLLIEGEALGAMKFTNTIKAKQIGKSAFVIDDDFPMSEIENWIDAEHRSCAANAEMFQIEMGIPEVKAARDTNKDTPF